MNKLTLQERINRLSITDDKTDPYILRARKNHARSYMIWHEEEDQILQILIEKNNSLDYIARKLQRSNKAIGARLKALNNETSIAILSHDELKQDSIQENSTKKTLRYWRNSIADADKMGLSFEQMKGGEQFALETFKNGHLEASKIKRFFDDAEEALKNEIKTIKKYQNKQLKKKDEEEEEEVIIKKLSFLIAPYTLVKNYDHGKKGSRERNAKELYPLWLIADITREGGLIASEELTFPWIERRCLAPNEAYLNNLIFPIIGEVAHIDEFYIQNNADLFSEKRQTWKDLLSYAQDLLFSLLDEDPDVLLKQNFSLLEKGYILPIKSVLEISKNLISTYDQYISSSDETIPELLKQICSLKDEKPSGNLSEEELFIASTKHLAEVQPHYPLSASQRISLSYLHANNNHNIFTIHGPPGTGKTKLLLSVIFSHWVDAAIHKKYPPILIASSTNNLAILNILDQFKKINPLNEKEKSIRWLPHFDSYGLYLVSNDNEEEAKRKGYIYRLKTGKLDTAIPLYNEEHKLHAKAYYLSKYNEFYHKTETRLENCQQFIHEELLGIYHLLQKTIYFAKDFYLIKKQNGSPEDLENEIVEIKSKIVLIVDKINNLKKVQVSWLLFKTKDLKWPLIFKWFPIGKSLLEDRVKLFTSQYNEIFHCVTHDLQYVEKFLIDNLSREENLLKEMNEKIKQLEHVKEQWVCLFEEKNILEKQLGFLIPLEDIFDFSSTTNLLSKLDISLRYKLFVLATHYWEARWLLESDIINSLKYNFDDRRKFWQIQAMLTPCFVTTLYSGPAFFQYKAPSQSFETLADFIDLLIIDEAGQVMPATAAPLISVAKKLLLVGDAKQIEPIYKLTESIDLANARKYGLCKDENDYEEMKKLGIFCSGNTETMHAYGNLITLGQRKAPYHLKHLSMPGMLLIEHRRCAKEIISYCNELCYEKQLQTFTVEKSSPFPRMGYAHIKGQEEKQRGSRLNKPEAETIVDWIIRNKNIMLSACEKEAIDDCVGIITPYVAQAREIKSLLSKHNLFIEKVGTVHSLQGAEKPFIIFSPVYTANERQNIYFFDRSPNMLNVAVSRAERSFLVFGDMDIFQINKNNLPSSLLAKFLFSKEENEIVGIAQPKFNQLKVHESNKVWQVNTLENHRKILKGAFSKAHYELNIVSPFLRMHAVQIDNIIDLIKQYSSKLNITIYTDPILNQNHLQEFNETKILLEKAGATVCLVKNVHSKIITIDQMMIVEGSFNWLSAARIGNFVREECSIIYAGNKVAEFIRKVLEPIKAKVMPSFANN
ncbi:MAG: hypothetical protein JO149_06880 [Gammaproteobacteria bacterium]|nr:hypothetical protein [Gammaproteobacteria bacterium]